MCDMPAFVIQHLSVLVHMQTHVCLQWTAQNQLVNGLNACRHRSSTLHYLDWPALQEFIAQLKQSLYKQALVGVY